MKNSLSFVLLIALLLLNVCAGDSQQPATKNRRTPKLTSEGGNLSGNNSLKNSDIETNPENISEWTRYFPGNRNFSLELPGGLHSLNMPLPDDLRSMFREIEGYAYNDNQISVLLCRFGSNKSFVSSAGLKDMAAGFINGATSRPGITDVKFSTTLDNPSQVSLVGSYNQEGITINLNGLVLAKGYDRWLLITGYAQANKAAQEPSKRVIKSVKLD